METSLTDPSDTKQEPLGNSVNDLCNGLMQLRNIHDGKRNIDVKIENFGEDLNGEEDEEETEDDDDLTEALLVQMGYWKPEPKNPPPPLNTPLGGVKLVSAFKGSREKEGHAAEERRRVSWGPDVYDPTPSEPDHFASSMTVRHRDDSRKSGKNKQKWGGKGAGEEVGGGVRKEKEKKRGRKKAGGGSANKYFEILDGEETLIDGGGAAAGGGGRKGGDKGKGKKQGKRHGGTSKLFDTLGDYY